MKCDLIATSSNEFKKKKMNFFYDFLINQQLSRDFIKHLSERGEI